jgi:dTDP-4-dehydrorhamnose 3,5-epimerase
MSEIPHSSFRIHPFPGVVMEFRPGTIDGMIWRPLRKFGDGRGWLCELFRHDDLPAEYHPVMGYISETLPGVARGPHEHVTQADCFCFLGPSDFRLYLWDNRPESPTYGAYETADVGSASPTLVIIPPGVVHAYRNIGTAPGIVINCPNQLYKGEGKREAVDEIRHEDDPRSPFRLPERRAA